MVVDEPLPKSCNETHCVEPLHWKVVALRIQGKRWSECAHAVGVDPITLWRWRDACPHIEANIGREVRDYLESTKIYLATLLPKATLALEEIIADRTHKDRHAAAKTALEMFRKDPGERDVTPGGVLAALRIAAGLPDGELDAALARVVTDRRAAKR